ncbi:hypothetical protein [uncultured Photobacterium sp.]|uniref:hypothetical protein n=1 Tax=uncultured Photobacterium sp. TaxID=173973 RepID=UPI002629DAC0|nr:hypothetical protein [uncultured Photobacterium sp.]
MYTSNLFSNIKSAMTANKVGTLMLFAMAFIFGAMEATAGAGGAAFQGTYDMFAEMANGYPGQIVAFLTVCGVLFFSIVRPNLIGLGGSVIIMVVLAQLTGIISGMLDAGLPV